MSTPLALNTLVKIRVGCYMGGISQAAWNTGYMVATAVAGAGGSDLDLAVSLDTGFTAVYPPLLNNEAGYNGTSCQIVNTAGKATGTVQQSTAGAAVGTAGATALAPQTCGLFRRQTAFPKQAGRGRCYVPFPSTAHDQGAGVTTGAYQTLLQALAAVWAAPVTVGAGGNTSTLTWILKPAGIGLTRTLTGYTTSIGWATQRRRGYFGRLNREPFT
jgi:hypothetical protein